MDKAKLKLQYIDAILIQDRLENVFTDYGHTDAKINKLMAAMWCRIYLKLKGKTVFKYSGQKTFSLDIEHAIAFELLLRRWIKTDEANPDERAAYRIILFRSLADLIDQKTA